MEDKRLPVLLPDKPVILQYSEIETLVQKHTISCQGNNLTNEMSFLRELIKTGQWNYIEQLLIPLKEYKGYSHSIYLVFRQEYIELLMSLSSLPRQQHSVERCKDLLTKMESLSPSSEEYNNLCSLLSDLSLLKSSSTSYSDWSIESSRGQLYHDLYLFLSSHMTLPHVTSLVQLVARGLLYQLCEQHILERCGLTTSLATGSVVDMLSWLRQLPDSAYHFQFNTLPISLSIETTPTSEVPIIKLPSIIQSKTTPTLIRSIPMQLSCPILSTSKVTPTPVVSAMSSLVVATPTPIVSAPPISLAKTTPTLTENPVPTVTTGRSLIKGPSIKTTPPGTPISLSANNIHVTPPHISSAPLSSSTPRDPSYRLSNHHSCVMLPTPIQTKEAWPDVSMATVFTDKQVVRSLCFSTDGSMTAIGANSRTLSILDSSSLYSLTDQTKTLYTHSNYHRGSIYCLNWYGNSLLASGSNDQTIQLLSTCNETFSVIGELKEFGGTVRDLTFLPKVTTRSLIACGGGENPLQIADIETLIVSRDFKPQQFPILSLATIDEHTFLTGDEKGTILLWDLRCSLFPTQIYSNINKTSINSLSIDTTGTILSCGTSSGHCYTVSLSTKGVLNEWSPHSEECRSVRYSPDGRWLMSSSFDGRICFTNTRTYETKCIASRSNKIIQSRWHPSGNLVGCASADKTATFWSVQYRQ